MGLGIRIRKLWTMRLGVLACAALAALAAVWSLDTIRLSPPGLKSRSLHMATASTQVMVDTPRSALLDLRRDTFSLESLTNRAVLLGNVMASERIRGSIERRAQVPAGALRVAPPLTPKQPRALAAIGDERHTSDILKLNDQYRLNIEANPTVPVLHIYAQTPTPESAKALADAAVDVMSGYLTGLAQDVDTPENEQIRLVQLGRARGAVINEGIEWQVALLAFLLTFAAACATLILIARIRDGYRLAALSERTAATS
jgi:hypothetical protein